MLLLVNFRAITALKPDVNGRIIATLENGEQVVISRQYAPDVKSKRVLRSSKRREGD
ncbi:MAG: LytTR family DNA-binding domain-containing protein [Atopobiaceae bacterium]|nr:LytTR family DNA-binding domain-containing protein [Atopobiaceae bacterium]